MTAHPRPVEIACDGPAEAQDCPQSAAVRAQGWSLTATEVRADGRQDGWTRRRRARRMVDLCPDCTEGRPAAQDAPRAEPHPTEADLRHALALLPTTSPRRTP